MKKRILSCLMALALCLTLLPTAALAEETEGTAQTPPAVEESADPANGEAKQESQPAETKQESQPVETKQENQPVETKQENQPVEAKPENQPAETKQESQPAEAKQENQPAEQGEQQEDSAAKQAVAAVQALIDALPDAEALDGMDDEDAMTVYEAFQTACDAYYDLTEGQQAQLKNTEKLEALSDWFSQLAALAAGTGHTHYLCGGTDCNQKGHEREEGGMTTFEPWTGSATTTGGAYYLTHDISGFTVHSGVKLTLCLNGYNITSANQGEAVITVEPGATLTLCDCKRGGTTGYGTIGHTRPDQYNGSGVTVENGTFNMYGGKIANNTVGNPDFNKSNGYGGGVLVFNKGIFNMIGGEITGNRAKYGGGVSVGTAYGFHDNTAEDIGGTFNMTGGKISGNFCASKGGGVYACVSSKLYFTVSGSAQITDNYTGNYLSSAPEEGTANNVYLEKYTDDNTDETIMATIKVGTLDSTASIGVTTEDAGQTVAKGVSEAAAKCFTCDDSSKYRLIYDSGERTLTMATAAHSAHPVCGETCSHNGVHQNVEWKLLAKNRDGKLTVDGTALPDNVLPEGNYYLAGNLELSDSIQTPGYKNVNLDLNGYTLTVNANAAAIYISSGTKFTLCDCTAGQTGKVTHGETYTGRGVYVTTSSTFTMYGGSITDNTVGTNDNGGGVFVRATGTFNMYGGSITGNSGYNGGGVYLNSEINGGTTYKATFNMNGGSITGNSGYNGGGVYVAGNSSNGSTFTMTGSACIANNKATKNNSTGGGVYVGTSANFNMTGGTISGNSGDYGGGVWSNGTFTMKGGTITQNAAKYGGGVWTSFYFTVSGNVKITDNTLNTGNTPNNVFLSLSQITIGTEGLKSEAKIGVTKGEIKTGEFVTVATGAVGSCTEGNFTADKGGEFGIKVEQGTNADHVNVNLYNGLPHVHPICGKTCADGKHAKILTWTGVASLDEITKEGNYYLTDDVVLNNTWNVPSIDKLGCVNLCLNGHSITLSKSSSDKNAICVGKTGYTALSISDCKGSGKITGASDYGVYVSNEAITAWFYLYGGTITGNGTGVYSRRDFIMHGGSITGNAVGVDYPSNNKLGSFRVSGDVNITGNQSADGTVNNVRLASGKAIKVIGALGENARIGVTTADEENSYVTVAKGGDNNNTYTLTAADLTHIESDNDAYDKWLNGNSIIFTNGDLHTHPICGKTCADKKHTDKIWQGVSSLRDITEAGYYCLTHDVFIGEAWKPVNGVVLCLNGHSIVAAGKFDAISVDTGVTFTLTDCKPEGTAGQITHSFDTKGERYISRGVYVSGTFNLYDGSIANNDTGKLGNPGGGVAVADSGTFNMYGGTITDNTAVSGGGVDLSDGTFNMTGGTITGNTTYGTENNGGGGVRVSKGTFTMSGNAVISGNKAASGGGGVHVNTRGKFTMSGDAVISGNTAAGSGGGVCVTESGTFTMEGGTIGGTDNGNTASGRGGGGVNVYNGTFTMKNGTISGNSADDSEGGDGNGGGVYVQGIGGSFNMSGGTINGNTAKSSGGGVFVQGANSSFIMGGNAVISGNTAESNGGGVYMKSAIGAFTMNGGTISGNKATGLNGNGGGVYVASLDKEPSKFIMNSGTISGNTASDYGGGVYVYSTTVSGGIFTMNGGTISGNNGTYGGGGVYVGKNAKMTVSGGARIEDNWKNGTLNEESGAYVQGTNGSANNLYLYSVAIDTLAGTAHIGVTTAKTPTAGDPVQFATGATNAALDYTTIFTPDAADQGYVVNKDGSGNLFLNAHRHNWTYTANTEGDTITAVCSECSASGGSLTIKAPDEDTLTYDGNGKAATLDNKLTTGATVSASDISYHMGESLTGNLPAGNYPTDAGEYKASITVGGVTASVAYTIEKATPKAEDFIFAAPTSLTYDGNTKSPDIKWASGVSGMGKIGMCCYNEDGEFVLPKDAGTYTVKINVAEGTNYTAATEVTDGSWTFTIGKGTQTVHVPAGKTIVKNGIAMDISDWANVTGVEGGETPGALSYALDGSYPGVTLTEGKMLKVQQIVAEDKVITIKATAAATCDYNEASETFTVTVADKQPVNLSVSMTDWTYGESANEPQYDAPEGVTATVTYAAQGSSDFSTTVPTDAGSYTVKVQYATDTEIRTGTAAFTISKREIAVPTADPTQFEYTGQEQTYVLSNFADAAYYTVSDTMKRTNAGSQNVTVQLKDKNNTVWKGGTDADKTYVFTIAPKPLSKVTIGDFPDKTYTGLSIQPVVVPVDDNTALIEDTDYTVSYGANTNVGKATITVTGTGNYTGTVSKEWNITPAVLTISGVTVADKTYNGSADATVTAVAFNGLKNGEELVIGTDYEVIGAAFNDENVGAANKVTGTVALKNTEKATNYTLSSAAFEQTAAIGRADYNGTASKTVNIVKGRSTVQTGTLTAADFFPEGQMPDGAKITAWSLTSPTTAILSAVSVGGGKLSYLSAKNIATASEESGSVTIATTNYKDITATLTFHPTDKLSQGGFKFENGSVTKTYGDGDFTLTTTGKVEGSTVTYESSEPTVATVDSATGKVTIKGAGTAVITARASATEEYDGAAATCTLTVEKKPIAIPTADATAFTYNGTEQTYALTENEAYTVSGNKQTNANETGYSVTAALKDTANTQWADGTAVDKTYTFVIGKAVITVKAKDQTAYVGDKAPTLGEDSYTVSGLVGEEKLTTQPTVKYVGADGSEITPDMTKTGEVKILAGGAAASDNYTIRYEDGKLTVSARLSGGGGGSSPSTNPVQAEVGKDPDGSVSLSKTSAAKGDKVTITVKPEQHYEVDEVIVRDSKGKQLAVKDNGDGTYTFEMPADKVTVEPTFTWVNPFADVANSAYYVDAVEWMLKREVTQGTTETTFSPNLNCTRAQIVTFLWRAAGSPEPKGTVGFADVPTGSYYAKAVAWAIENGITGGTGDGLFSPDATCTRAQSAAFLYRAAGSPAVSGSAGFSDVAADAYYARAVAWAKEHGITGGIGGGLFGSANDCTRAQIAAFLWRLYAEK